ncbi:hypothetical protein [Spiroplasma endosymbiont of Glossina fuscipes fuscipes]|uniref:hypothetical protein n=1 Tax=Spiroplasma endosymbiont of Glossina fuscipes fuscipes TaxID=2004463 RepID=UPI003C781C96
MNNWDNLLLYPFLTILVMVSYFIGLVKKGAKSFWQWAFIVQHFCFWLALSCALTLNYNFIIFDFTKNIISIAILFAVSTLFYAAVFLSREPESLLWFVVENSDFGFHMD